MRNSRPPKKFVTRGEKASARAQLDMLKNPWSGDSEFEKFQEEEKKSERPIRDAAKKVYVGWGGLALGGKSGQQKAENWNEALDKIETPKKGDSKALKVAKGLARATPVPLVATALTSGMVPVAVYPALKGSSELIRTIGSQAKKKADERKDVKVLAKSTRPGASLYEQRAGEIVRNKYTARGLKQEEIDKKKYGAQPTTYSSTTETKKFRKK